MLRIGTDEAGYGPLLGPLVIAAAVHESARPREELPREGVADSKVLYARGGRDALARSLGPYLSLPRPVRLGDLLAQLAIRPDPRAGYPWYGEVEDPVPPGGPAPTSFRRLYVNPLCEREFNAGCTTMGGKAGLLFHETMALVRRALADAPGVDADVVCDKHGGRNRYAAFLLAAFSPRSLVAERESAACSAYRLDLGNRRVRVSFVRRADASDPAVALASMAAKYVREMFMESLNRYFAERVDGLRPTAGYHTDGLRFLGEVQGVLAELGLERDGFVRLR